MLSGAIVPHAPLLAIGANSDGIPAARQAIAAALGAIRSISCDLVIVISPHGPTGRVYRAPGGSLSGFGVPDLSATTSGSGSQAALAAEWGVPVMDGSDHGIVVPLLLGALPDAPVVACALAEWTGASTRPGGRGDPSAALDSAARLAAAILSVAGDLRVLVVCSAHGPAGLSPRAPLTERPESRVLERRILDALSRDPGGLAGIGVDEWAAGGACGAGPLAVFGRLFAGRSAEVVAYEAPVGVGYLVARTT